MLIVLKLRHELSTVATVPVEHPASRNPLSIRAGSISLARVFICLSLALDAHLLTPTLRDFCVVKEQPGEPRHNDTAADYEALNGPDHAEAHDDAFRPNHQAAARDATTI